MKMLSKHGQLRDLRGRNRESALEHILHDARRFQTDRLAAGIGTRDDEDVFAAVQLQVQRHDLASRGFQRLLQQRMAGVLQHQPVVGREDRPHAAVLRGPAPLGAQHVHLREVVARIGDQPGVGTDRLGELGQDAHDLAPLGILQFAQLVVDLHHLDRLDVEGLARRRLVVDESVQFAFVARGDRNHGPPVADRDLGVGIDDARPLAAASTACKRLAACPSRSRMARRISCKAGEALSFTLPKPSRMASMHRTISGNAATPARAGIQRRIALLAAEDEGDDAADDRQRLAQGHDLLHVEERPLDAQFGDDVIDVGILVRRGNRAPFRAARRISSASARRRSISRGEVEKPSSASRPRAARMVQRAATCSRSRSKPIFCSNVAG